jgi:hypothetical protein
MLHVSVFTGLFWMDSESLSLNKEDSMREIAEIREKYQRRYLTRLIPSGGDDLDKFTSFRKDLHDNDRIGFIMDSDRNPDHLLRQFYMDTKARVYIDKEDLSWFFDVNFVSHEWLISCILGIHDLLNHSISGMSNINPKPIAALKSFLETIFKNIKVLSTASGGNGVTPWDSGLDLLFKQLFKESPNVSDSKYDFKRNFLIPEFMKLLEEFGEYLCENARIFTGQEEKFVSVIYKIFAMIAGEALGAYYLYSTSLDHKTTDMEKIDMLLGEAIGACNI